MYHRTAYTARLCESLVEKATGERFVAGMYHYSQCIGTDVPLQRTDNDSEVTVQAMATPTPTKETLNGTTNYFSHFRRKKTSEPTSKEGKSPEEETLSTKRKRLGIAPWHRKASDVSAVWSATSSFKGLLMGKTPMTSPHLERIQQESEQYFQGRWHFDERRNKWTDQWLITNSRRLSGP